MAADEACADEFRAAAVQPGPCSSRPQANCCPAHEPLLFSRFLFCFVVVVVVATAIPPFSLFFPFVLFPLSVVGLRHSFSYREPGRLSLYSN
jgi:hypothetical protein